VPLFQTDTASVLQEAIGYIRFLHGQIEVQFALSSLSLSRSLYHVKQKESSACKSTQLKLWPCLSRFLVIGSFPELAFQFSPP
jgi:hypothetical protein